MQPTRRWICQVVDLLVAFAEFGSREAIRVPKRDICGTQLEFLIWEQRSVTFIQNLIQAVPEGGTKGEQIPKEWCPGLYCQTRIFNCLELIGMGQLRLPCVAVDDRHNAKGSDENGEELAKLPVELEQPYCNDVGEEGVRVPDRSDIAEPVMRRDVS